MNVENAVMRLSDLIMEREQLRELIQKELKYNRTESAKTSVIATVDFLSDEIATLKDILKDLDQLVTPTVSIWFVTAWIPKTMFFHHVVQKSYVI